jgi:hypothetical protein
MHASSTHCERVGAGGLVCRQLRRNSLDGTIPTEMGLMTSLTSL